MKVLVMGANSAIAQASIAALAKRQPQAQFYLVGRNADKLAQVCDHLRESEQAVKIIGSESLDLRDHPRIAQCIDHATQILGGLDTVIIAHGALADQNACQNNPELLEAMVDQNFTSQAIILNTALARIAKGGTIAVISSVAGEGSRPASATYSATKAALSRYIQGMHGTAATKKVRIIDIRPGWVETPLVANSRSKFLCVQPSWAGTDIARAILGRRPAVLYTPWFWRFVMMPIKAMPMWAFRALRPRLG